MRSPHSRLSARQRARVTGGIPLLPHRIPARQILQGLARWRPRLERWPTLPILLAVLALAVLLGGWTPRTAAIAAQSGAPALAAHQQLASGPRTVARWFDPAGRTAMLLALLESQGQAPGTLTFTLPSGDEVQAQKLGPLLVLARELSQLSPDATFDVATTVCGPATLLAAKPASGAGIAQQVNMVLGVHIGQGGLLAYAGLNYTPVAPVLFAAAATSCVLTSPQYEMKAGCSDLKSPCAVLPTPAQAAAQYDQSMVTAAAQGNWDTVYALTGQAVTAQYSSTAAFGTVMQQQVQRVGRITALTPAGAPSAIQLNAQGQAYFVAQDNMTLDHNGSMSQKLITSYYVLEGGGWRFWFSCGAGSHC
jgi:hypothetical protein